MRIWKSHDKHRYIEREHKTLHGADRKNHRDEKRHALAVVLLKRAKHHVGAHHKREREQRGRAERRRHHGV
ncbi:MAG: hypothetical protein L6U61_04470 [Bacteroidales bacterium]|nr:MAG: hypothetical protein L6U61_04470 [Bacteroidales bacterium]